MTTCCATCYHWEPNGQVDFGRCPHVQSERFGQFTHGARILCDSYAPYTSKPLPEPRKRLEAQAAESPPNG